MKRFLTVAALCLGTMAFAGDRLLGIIAEIGASKSNLSQNPDGQGAWWDGGFSQPFYIPQRSMVTLQCNNEVFVCTDRTTCTATTGVALNSGSIFLTSVGASGGAIDQGRNPDAGLAGGANINPIASAVISIVDQVSDAGYHQCKVFERMGNE